MATAIGENIVVIDHDDDFIRAGYANPEYGPGVLAPASVRLASDATSDAIPPTRVIVDRAVTDWDALEAIYRHIFYKQCGWIEGEEGAALITEPLFTSKADRERLTQLMFESFNVAGLYIAEQPVAALYGVGKTSGVSVDVGFSTTDIAPVVDGVVVTAAATRCALGTVTTRDATRSLLGDAGAALSDDDVDAVRDATCHVSRSRDDALDASDSKTHVLPDGNVVTVDGAARRACVESLFAPDADKGGVSEASVLDAIFTHGGWAGGVGARSGVGLGRRITSDLHDLMPPTARPVEAGAPEYAHALTGQYASWFGGAILAKVVFPLNQYVTKVDYQENGPTVVHKNRVG
ncbi:actin superfamily [Micromonas pusilla CCMP1545]|uniref:Actin superfamily n=1 Tax=Micromonas pusilla (strain CCMP1545) TaxID=564608 RepID=C1N2V0_MICPC|nr:actin superfamily [Micromonas pusilla CCMP1545]EEH53858.1 actin superfamily [Micromonas pusilla CCMP1545]|eukprot:XP_003062146.1 actin superfamily [Micromonas pusilla CCMP1545]